MTAARSGAAEPSCWHSTGAPTRQDLFRQGEWQMPPCSIGRQLWAASCRARGLPQPQRAGEAAGAGQEEQLLFSKTTRHCSSPGAAPSASAKPAAADFLQAKKHLKLLPPARRAQHGQFHSPPQLPSTQQPPPHTPTLLCPATACSAPTALLSADKCCGANGATPPGLPLEEENSPRGSIFTPHPSRAPGLAQLSPWV